MEKQPIKSVTRFLLTQLLYTILWVGFSATRFWVGATAAATTQELLTGFTATPDPSLSPFQALLSDSSGNYSLGFLRVNGTRLALAVVHIPSYVPIWAAQTNRAAKWSKSTRVSFNGSLVISDPRSGVFWTAGTEGDRVWLSNASNLQIQKLGDSPSVLWQSFHFPSDTLVENQNFTNTMSLVSSNGLYSMRLGSDFIGLYAKFSQHWDSDQIYWKRRALQAKADIVEGQGPIHLLLSSDGFLGIYQNGSIPADVQSFSSFQQKGGIRRVRVEPDGNLKGYYWTGSSWVLDYEAISDPCELPSPCGPYGLCQPGKHCSCLENWTDYNSGRCASPENTSGDLCDDESKYRVLRRSGVDLPNKELMGYEKMASLDHCESSCEENCTCRGVVYSNSSGFCYMVEYPIQTLLGVGDKTKVGYFKVREGAGKKKGYGAGIGLLCGAVLVLGGVVGYGLYRLRLRRKRGFSGCAAEEDGGGVVVGPYKDLASASFKSLELCQR